MMDLMEDLLCPQVCMDVEETPIKIDTSDNKGQNDQPTEADIVTLPEELKIRLLMEESFTFEESQIPHKLLPHEENALKGDFNEDEHLTMSKLHCTVCNVHFGSACVNQLNRYIHPDLNVLICKVCFLFYGSGSFDKDEDGSELYCKWCAQGGSVMCCSSCPFVFCQKCVRRNLGPRKLSEIKNSDNWKCFRCVPEQLSELHINAHVLHEYTKRQIHNAAFSKDIQLLKKDMCACSRGKRKGRSLNLSDDENDEYIPTKTVKPAKRTKTLQSAKKLKPEVQSELRTTFKEPPKRILPKIASNLMPVTQTNMNPIFNKLQLQSVQNRMGPQPMLRFRLTTADSPAQSNTPTLAQLMPNIFNASTSRGLAPRQQPVPHQVYSNQSPKRIVLHRHNVNRTMPPLRPVSNLPLPSFAQQQQQQQQKPEVKTGDKQIAWLKQAVHNTKIYCSNLMKQIAEVEGNSYGNKTYVELADLHNKTQNAITVTTTMLTDTRKTMHKEFLSYLSRLNVSHKLRTQKTPLVAMKQAAGLKIVKQSNNKSRKRVTASAVSTLTSLNMKKPMLTAEINLCDDEDIDEHGAEKDPLALDDDHDHDQDEHDEHDNADKRDDNTEDSEDDEAYETMTRLLEPEIVMQEDVCNDNDVIDINSSHEEILDKIDDNIDDNELETELEEQQVEKEAETIDNADKVVDKTVDPIEVAKTTEPEVTKPIIEEKPDETPLETDKDDHNESMESTNSFRQCVEERFRQYVKENSKIPFDHSLMSYEEFKRAIRVRAVIDKSDKTGEDQELPPETLLDNEVQGNSLQGQDPDDITKLLLDSVGENVLDELAKSVAIPDPLPLPLPLPLVISNNVQNKANSIDNVQDIDSNDNVTNVGGDVQVQVDDHLIGDGPPTDLPLAFDTPNLSFDDILTALDPCGCDTTIDGDLVPSDV